MIPTISKTCELTEKGITNTRPVYGSSTTIALQGRNNNGQVLYLKYDSFYSYLIKHWAEINQAVEQTKLEE